MIIDLHHRTDGPDDAPVLVLGPSLGTDLHLFDAQVAALADRFRIVRYDLPGHGDSPTPDGPYTMDGMARAAEKPDQGIMLLAEHPGSAAITPR